MLVLLWLISPLGSQAALRLLSTSISPLISFGNIGYANLTQTDSWSDLDTSLDTTIFSSDIDVIYISSLASSSEVKQSPQDEWGNVKIPTYESLSTDEDADGFKPLLYHTETDWSSLLGIPMTGLNQNMGTNATLSTKYYYIDCMRLYGVDGSTDWPADVGLSMYGNSTSIWTSGDIIQQFMIFFTGSYANDTTSKFPTSSKTNLTFAAWSGGSLSSSVNPANVPNVTIAECTVEPSFIDLKISCSGYICNTTDARRSAITMPSNTSSPDFALWWGQLFNKFDDFHTNFPFSWPQAAVVAVPGAASTNPTLQYINDSSILPMSPDWPNGHPFLFELELGNFTQRFRRLFNTYWQTAAAPNCYSNTISPNATANKLSFIQNGMMFNTTRATFFVDATVYRCNLWWFTITIIVSCILLIIGFMGFAGKCFCVGPDILMSFTTTLRADPKNAHLLDNNNSTMDSGKLAMTNQDLYVTLKDIHSDEKRGLIAINLSTDRIVRRLRIATSRKMDKSRLYD
jgi:hypothetical protein